VRLRRLTLSRASTGLVADRKKAAGGLGNGFCVRLRLRTRATLVASPCIGMALFGEIVEPATEADIPRDDDQ
jgi:hypothetical protein